jgi:hypothetical protein
MRQPRYSWQGRRSPHTQGSSDQLPGRRDLVSATTPARVFSRARRRDRALTGTDPAAGGRRSAPAESGLSAPAVPAMTRLGGPLVRMSACDETVDLGVSLDTRALWLAEQDPADPGQTPRLVTLGQAAPRSRAVVGLPPDRACRFPVAQVFSPSVKHGRVDSPDVHGPVRTAVAD